MTEFQTSGAIRGSCTEGMQAGKGQAGIASDSAGAEACRPVDYSERIVYVISMK